MLIINTRNLLKKECSVSFFGISYLYIKLFLLPIAIIIVGMFFGTFSNNAAHPVLICIGIVCWNLFSSTIYGIINGFLKRAGLIKSYPIHYASFILVALIITISEAIISILYIQFFCYFNNHNYHINTSVLLFGVLYTSVFAVPIGVIFLFACVYRKWVLYLLPLFFIAILSITPIFNNLENGNVLIKGIHYFNPLSYYLNEVHKPCITVIALFEHIGGMLLIGVFLSLTSIYLLLKQKYFIQIFL